MYNRGTASHSSIIGGLLTLIFSIAMLTYAVIVFRAIANRDNYNLQELQSQILGLSSNNQSIKDMIMDCQFKNDCEIIKVESFMNTIGFLSFELKNNNRNDCDEVFLTVQFAFKGGYYEDLIKDVKLNQLENNRRVCVQNLTNAFKALNNQKFTKEVR